MENLKSRIQTRLVWLSNEKDGQDDFLNTELFDVNMRLFRTSPEYLAIIRSILNYMSQVLCTKFHNYPELKGISGANVGIPFNIIGFKDEQDAPIFMINPKIIDQSDNTRVIDSNCGSLLLEKPIRVKRASMIKVEFYNLAGVKRAEAFKDRVAATIQHEIDHNKGITILDRARELEKE